MDPVRKTSRLLAVVVGVLVVAVMYVARTVLIPFALAVLISFVLAPIVAWLQRRKIPRAIAVLASVLVLLSVTGGVGWVIVGEARDLVAKMPEYRENTRHKTGLLRDIIGKPLEAAATTVQDMGSGFAPEAQPSTPPPIVRLAEPTPGLFQSIRDLLDPVVGFLATAVMTLLFAVVMLLRPEDLRDRFIRIVGSGQIYVTTQAIDDASGRVSRYLIRQMLVNGLLGAAFGFGLLAVGVPDALLFGFLFTLLRFVPYVGVWIAAALPFFLSLIISDGWGQPLQVLGIFTLVELAGSFGIEPWIYGAGTGLSPLAILISALFWSWLWGPIGLVLSTPITVCLVVMGKYVPQLHFLSLLFSDAPALPPPARLYQRLLAQDHDEAWGVVKAEFGDRAPREVIDSAVLPALSMAERDLQQGTLDPDFGAQIRENVQLLIDEIDDADAAYAAAKTSDDTPRLSGLRALCLPARSESDALVAAQLAHQLSNAGAEVEIVPLAELMGETVKNLSQRPVDIVFVSAIAPTRLLHVRYICKRLSKLQGLEIIVGLWTLEVDAPGVAQRLPSDTHIHVVATLQEAVAKARQLAGSLRIVRSAAS